MAEREDLLNERYTEICEALGLAINNKCNWQTIDNLTALKNSYFIAMQLIESHKEISSIRVVKLKIIKNRARLKAVYLKQSVTAIKEDVK